MTETLLSTQKIQARYEDAERDALRDGASTESARRIALSAVSNMRQRFDELATQRRKCRRTLRGSLMVHSFVNDAAERINGLSFTVLATYDAVHDVLSIDTSRARRIVPVCGFNGTVSDDLVFAALSDLFPFHDYASRYCKCKP